MKGLYVLVIEVDQGDKIANVELLKNRLGGLVLNALESQGYQGRIIGAELVQKGITCPVAPR